MDKYAKGFQKVTVLDHYKMDSKEVAADEDSYGGGVHPWKSIEGQAAQKPHRRRCQSGHLFSSWAAELDGSTRSV